MCLFAGCWSNGPSHSKRVSPTTRSITLERVICIHFPAQVNIKYGPDVLSVPSFGDLKIVIDRLVRFQSHYQNPLQIVSYCMCCPVIHRKHIVLPHIQDHLCPMSQKTPLGCNDLVKCNSVSCLLALLLPTLFIFLSSIWNLVRFHNP